MRTSVPIAFMLALSTAIGCGLGGRNPAGNNNGDNGGNNGSNGNNGNNGNGNNGNNGNNGPVTPTVVLAPGAPMDAASQFGGADNPALAAMIVYPPDGVLIPPNLNELEVQFTPVAATKLYEVAFAGASLDLRIYTPCNAVGNGCSLTPDAPTWILLSSAARSQTITVTVRATDGTGVGTSAPHKLSFGDDDIDGGLYYWAASTGAINRYDFGLRGQKAEAFYTPAQAGGITQCVGCHALSQNGARIAVGLNAPGEEMRILDVATRTTLYDESFMSFMGNGLPSVSVFEALAPDGSRIVTVEGGGLTLRDGGTGALVGAMPALANATMPDVSPDGKRVVYTRDGSGLGNLFAFGNPEVMQGTLLVASLGATTITNEKPLVPSGGENNYYPSFSPDGAWVIFNRASGASYDAPDAVVYAVSVAGGNPIELTTANDGMGNSWPKWAPFIQHFQGATIFWIAFSSRRPYGLHGGANAQIWMAAVDPQKLAHGADPGYPAFWLPFQDPTTGNHIPQWTQKVARQPCMVTGVDQTGGCQQGETCQNGVCIPNIM